MIEAPIPLFEKERICVVQGLKLLDTSSEERFDVITKKAIWRFSVPISTISIIDSDREWFKSMQGVSVNQSPREISFCGHALLSPILMVIEDTLLDKRFFDNPMVKGDPFIRFYAGKALYDKKSNLPVGVFCIKDTKPRKFDLNDTNDFLDLAEQAEIEINKNIS